MQGKTRDAQVIRSLAFIAGEAVHGGARNGARQIIRPSRDYFSSQRQRQEFRVSVQNTQ
jgi:hypothetical protein